MTLTKNHLINALSKQLSIPKMRSTTLVESFLNIMKDTLESGEDVLISGFGKFCVRDKNERRGRDPQTGKEKILDARRVVIFKSSGVLRDKINGKG